MRTILLSKMTKRNLGMFKSNFLHLPALKKILNKAIPPFIFNHLNPDAFFLDSPLIKTHSTYGSTLYIYITH